MDFLLYCCGALILVKLVLSIVSKVREIKRDDKEEQKKVAEEQKKEEE